MQSSIGERHAESHERLSDHAPQTRVMSANLYPDLQPAEGEVETAELVVSDDVLVKAFALGPGATVDPHRHDDSTNVFHVLDGAVTVVRDGDREHVTAPAVIHNERGVEHGLQNEGDDPAVVTASLAPMPG